MQDKKICYCFDYTEGDIIKDVRENNGRSTILEKIMAEKKKGGCRCNYNHPEGR